jgi:hypothetical protein
MGADVARAFRNDATSSIRCSVLSLVVVSGLGVSRCVHTQVIPTPRPEPKNSETALAYQGWKTAFRLADTELGAATALLDSVTRLEWLNLSKVQHLSADELKKRMSNTGDLAGWRFATLEEARRFVEDFVQEPEPSSRDLSKERALQSLWGGTLDSAPGPNAWSLPGWSRRWSTGVVNQAECVPKRNPPGEPPLPEWGCDGYKTFHLYVAEDAENGQTTATIKIEEAWIATARDLGTSEGEAIMLVRPLSQHER